VIARDRVIEKREAGTRRAALLKEQVAVMIERDRRRFLPSHAQTGACLGPGAKRQ